MGQDAGAASILHHLVALGGDEDYKPPFAQAILQSPSFLPEGDLSTTDQSYLDFQYRAACPSLHSLRSKDTAELQKSNAESLYYSLHSSFQFGPTMDQEFLQKRPGQFLLNCEYHKKVPLILGDTALDGLLFSPPWVRDDQALGKHLREIYPRARDLQDWLCF